MSEKRTIEHDFGGLGIAATVVAIFTIFAIGDMFGEPDADFYDVSDAIVCMGGQAPCAARARETARIARNEAMKAQLESLEAQARETRQ